MLRTRLYLGLLPLLLLFLAVCAASALLYRDLARDLDRNLAGNYASLVDCYDMRAAASAMASAVSAAQAGAPDAASRDYEAQRSRFKRAFMDQSLALAGHADRAAMLDKLDASFSRFDQASRDSLATGGDYTLASLRATQTNLRDVLDSLETLVHADYAAARQSTQTSTRLARASADLLWGAMAIAFLLSLYLAYRLARSLLRPIRLLKTSAAALGEGRLDQDVPVTSRDELGELARTFNGMAAKLRAYRDAMTERVTWSRRTMEATLASTPDPLLVIGRDGRHEVRNPAAEALAAAPDWPPDDLPESLARPLREVLDTGVHYLPSSFDHVVSFHADDGEHHYLPRILAIGDELTGFGGAAVILQDVTKLRLLDTLKGNLVSTVSHELKTPLTSLRMAVLLLLEKSFGPITPQQADLLQTACDDADRLLRILDDLLDLSRLEAGISAPVRRPVPVRALLDDMAAGMATLTAAARQRLVVQVDASLDTIPVDPDRIRHVFGNLLSNASKYSGEGTTITLYAEPADAGFVRFGVRDQGPGIPEENAARVFEKFYRVPGQEKKGAGLGLAIAREIVVAHGGSIACASRVGEGTDFYFLLPATPPANAEDTNR